MELEKHSHAQKMAILDAHRRVDLLPLPEKYVEHKDDEPRHAELLRVAKDPQEEGCNMDDKLISVPIRARVD